jgi:CRP-like cAMP-binding protein
MASADISEGGDGMYMPTRYASPRDRRPSSEVGQGRTAGRGLLENLAYYLGRLIAMCKLGMERADVPRTPGWMTGPTEEMTAPQRPDPGGVIFWEALDPVEREAFRAVAVFRTFAAGARLMEEGDHAGHVIVILSGRTKICVEQDGTERILAERGPGQLVGERAALHISVRSASVVALETVQALVMRTRDFAAFITAHPTVLDIVENQLYDRLTEDQTRYSPSAHRRPSSAREGAAERVSSSLPAGRPAQLQELNGENCTIILSDVVGFGARSRTDEDRRIIRETLYRMTRTALEGLPSVWSLEDRGDGLLTVVPPTVPSARVIEHLHRELPPALDRHNRAHRDSARIQLRVAVDVGPVASDAMGVSGEAIIVTARLVEAPLFKEALRRSKASMGVIVSTFIYETVIRHGPDLNGYSPVQADVKELSIPAWMRLFDAA